MADSAAPILLVHGACHGAWCWHKLLPELALRNLTAVAIDLPGCGDDPTPASTVSLRGWGDAIAAALASFGRPAILVGHSLGGMAITEAAEIAPQHIQHLVYLAAALPRDGETVTAISQRVPAYENHVEMVVSENGAEAIFEPSIVARILYGDCTAEDARYAASRLRPVPLQIFGEPATVSAAGSSIPRSYIECTQDLTVPLSRQRSMAAQAEPIDIYSMATSHSPFLSQPGLLAEILAKIARPI